MIDRQANGTFMLSRVRGRVAVSNCLPDRRGDRRIRRGRWVPARTAGFIGVSMSEGDVQRALVSMAGEVGKLGGAVTGLTDKLGTHMNDDQAALSDIRRTVQGYQIAMTDGFEKQTNARNAMADSQRDELRKIIETLAWAKGAGYVIMGLLAIIAPALLAVVIKVFAP